MSFEAELVGAFEREYVFCSNPPVDAGAAWVQARLCPAPLFQTLLVVGVLAFVVWFLVYAAPAGVD